MRRLRLLWIFFLVLVCAGFAYAGSKAEAQAKLTNDDCLACHSDGSMVDGKASSRRRIQGFDPRFDVHLRGLPYGREGIPHDAGLAKPKCITCHADEQKAYDNGIHGKALAAGNAKAAQLRKLPRQCS